MHIWAIPISWQATYVPSVSDVPRRNDAARGVSSLPLTRHRRLSSMGREPTSSHPWALTSRGHTRVVAVGLSPSRAARTGRFAHTAGDGAAAGGGPGALQPPRAATAGDTAAAIPVSNSPGRRRSPSHRAARRGRRSPRSTRQPRAGPSAAAAASWCVCRWLGRRPPLSPLPRRCWRGARPRGGA